MSAVDVMNYLVLILSLAAIVETIYICKKQPEQRANSLGSLVLYIFLVAFFFARSFGDIPAPTRGITNKAITVYTLLLLMGLSWIAYKRPFDF